MGENSITFIDPEQEKSIIKVIGVGGGGSNAVNYMHRNGINGVDFIVCNTDEQALNSSPVQKKLRIGTEGAGGLPEVGRQSALDHIEDIKKTFDDNTRMVFITTCLGGGTGTGASPVIAEEIHKLKVNDKFIDHILTVAIVSMPFSFECKKKRTIARAGLEELSKHVDSIIAINNDKLRSFGNITMDKAFDLANDVLLVATKGIADIITSRDQYNTDFHDVYTALHDSETALMGIGIGKGEDRAIDAIKSAATSVLLDDNDIKGAKHCLLHIRTSSQHPLTIDEFSSIQDYINENISDDEETELKWGQGYDDTLDDEVKLTLIATGFKTIDNNSIDATTTNKTNKISVTPTTPVNNNATNETNQHNEDIIIAKTSGSTQTANNTTTTQSTIHIDENGRTTNNTTPNSSIKPQSYETQGSETISPKTSTASAINNPIDQSMPPINLTERASRVKAMLDVLKNDPNGTKIVASQSLDEYYGASQYHTVKSDESEISQTAISVDGILTSPALLSDVPD